LANEENELKKQKGSDSETEDKDDDIDDNFTFEEEDDPATLLAETSQMRSLLDQFTPEQSSRYEYYRRSSFQRANIKKIMQTISNNTINQKMAIVMSGITKIFVGEITETAKCVMEEWGEQGSIRPKHIREAYRRLKQDGKIPYLKPERQLLR